MEIGDPDEYDDSLKYFFPLYPDLDQANFIANISRKYEFATLKLTEEPYAKVEVGEYLPHQLTIARFMSRYTDWKKLLLFQSPGTGKTCTTLAVAEGLLKSKVVKKVIVIASSPSGKRNFKNELMHRCPTSVHGYNEKDYEFRTYGEFASDIRNFFTPRNLVNQYDYTLIIMDEIHNIINRGKNGVQKDDKNYKVIKSLIDILPHVRLLLSSGTPMYDSSIEIIPIINLLLPPESQLNVLNKNIYSIPMDVLKNAFAGRVSVVKNKLVDLNVIYHGESEDIIREDGSRIEGLKIQKLLMSDFQSEVYNNSINIQYEQRKSFYLSIIDAAMCVDHNGNYSNQTIDLDTFINILRACGNNTDRILMLQKYSCVYAESIRIILDNPDDKIFIYNSRNTGSGNILFAQILQTFNFSKYSPGTTIEAPLKNRYILLNSDVSTSLSTNEMEQVMREYSMSRNAHGDYVRIIIGSAKVSEIYTFTNTTIVIGQSPSWNLSTINQFIARVVRLNAHKELMSEHRISNPLGDVSAVGLTPSVGVSEQKPIDIHIHLLCPIPNPDFIHLDQTGTLTPENQYSIYNYMYKTSILKDVEIKYVERIMLESSIDCYLNYDRNKEISKSLENKRECYYGDCRILCDGDFGMVKKILYDTYNIYYSDDYFPGILQAIVYRLVHDSFISYADLIQISNVDVENTFKSYFQVCMVLMIILNTKSLMYANTNLYEFFNIGNRGIYLSAKPRLNDYYYETHQYIVTKNITEIVDTFNNSGIRSRFAKFDTKQISVERMQKMIIKLDDPIIVKLLERSIILTILGNENEKTRAMLEIFGSSIFILEDVAYHCIETSNYKKLSIPTPTIGARPFSSEDRRSVRSMADDFRWKLCTSEDNQIITRLLIERLHVDKNFPYIASFIIMKSNFFKMKKYNPTAELFHMGQDCGTFTKFNFNRMFETYLSEDFNINDIKKMTRPESCKLLREYMLRNNKFIVQIN